MSLAPGHNQGFFQLGLEHMTLFLVTRSSEGYVQIQVLMIVPFILNWTSAE